jgi:hypothetical protein
MLLTFTPATVDAVQWTGDNTADVTAHLGTSDWKQIAGTDTRVGWWLYRDEFGDVCAMSDAMAQTRTTGVV